MKSHSWQEKRSRFNHDWLKNQFLPAIGKWLQIVRKEVADAEFQSRFSAEILPAWEIREVLVIELLDTFEEEMSPRVWLGKPPLSRLGPATRDWLAQLVHSLWLARMPVHAWLREARKSVAEVSNTYRVLQRVMKAGDARGAIDPPQCYEESESFRLACVQLSKALEQFPNKIEVT